MTVIRRLVLELERPVHTGQGSRGSFINTPTHIPAPALTGALATAFAAQAGLEWDSPEFLSAFGPGTRVSPAYVEGGLPVPTSFVQHKYMGECPWVFDEAGTIENRPHVKGKCPECGTPIGRPGTTPDGVIDARGAEAERRWRGEVAMKMSGVAVESTLRAREHLGLGQKLHAYVAGWGDRELPSELRVGGARGTQGRVSLSFGEHSEASARDLLPSVRKMGEGYALVFAAMSPAVLVDRMGRATPELDLRAMEELIDQEVTSQRSWVRWAQVGGWDAASGLPKPIDWVAETGSTWMLAVRKEPVAGALAALTEHGIGLRRGEGFGWICGPPAVRPAESVVKEREVGRAKQERSENIATRTSQVVVLSKRELLKGLADGGLETARLVSSRLLVGEPVPADRRALALALDKLLELWNSDTDDEIRRRLRGEA